MAKAWVCPACGRHNALDASECSSCGRWASVFDLERTVDLDEQGITDDEWEAIDAEVAPAPEPETAVESVPLSVDTEPVVTTTEEPTPEPRQRRFPKWVIPVAIAAYVAIRALMENV